MPIPIPEPGLVINYAYLWHDEHKSGKDEGRKNCPSVIVVCVGQESDGATLVTVLPVTHRPPREANAAIEIPAAVNRHLRLDDERSWIVVTEGNEFVWPGYDLRKVPHADHFDYGFLPPRLFDKVRDAFVAFHKVGRARNTRRT